MEDNYNNEGEELIIQYTVMFPQEVGCGGGAIKVMPEGFEQTNFDGSVPFLIALGPDIWGEKKIKIDIHSHGYKATWKVMYEPPEDKFTHLYRLVIKPDNSYRLMFDYEYIIGRNKLNNINLSFMTLIG